MGCNCGKRGVILQQAATALRQGNVVQAASRVGTVARSMATDAYRLVSGRSSSTGTQQATPYVRPGQTITRI